MELAIVRFASSVSDEPMVTYTFRPISGSSE